jgi:hypothetical protein
MDCIFENYSDFIRVNKSLYSVYSDKNRCDSSKMLIRKAMEAVDNLSFDEIIKTLFNNGRVLKKLTIRNEMSTIKSKS